METLLPTRVERGDIANEIDQDNHCDFFITHCPWISDLGKKKNPFQGPVGSKQC